MRLYWLAQPRGGTCGRRRLRRKTTGGATVGGEARSRRLSTSLRRFGAAIPGKLLPSRACFRFTAPAYHAIAIGQTQFGEPFWRSLGLPRAPELWHVRAQFLFSPSLSSSEIPPSFADELPAFGAGEGRWRAKQGFLRALSALTSHNQRGVTA